VTQPANADLVVALSGFDAAVEVGIGGRTALAGALGDAGTSVVAVDLDRDRVGDVPGSVAFVAADIHNLATAESPAKELVRNAEGTNDPGGVGDVLDPASVDDATDPTGVGDATDVDPAVPGAFDLVYARNLPAELQRPTVELAARLDAVPAFTTLGFEEPVVDVARRTVGDDTLYVASDGVGGVGGNDGVDSDDGNDGGRDAGPLGRGGPTRR